MFNDDIIKNLFIEDIILYDRNKNIYNKYISFELNTLPHNNVYNILTLLSKNIQYYNDKQIVLDKINELSLRKVMCLYINLSLCNKQLFYSTLYIDKYYNMLIKEYLVKFYTDKCLKELKEYIQFKNVHNNFIKNELLWNIHHYYMIHFKFAKRIEYEFIPKGFIDS